MKSQPPEEILHHTYEYTVREDIVMAMEELEQYRASNNVNLQCKESIEAAVREHFDGMYLSHDAAKGVIETYGMERVSMVLSNTVQLLDWDGRYSRRNKEWAKTIPNDNPETVRCGYALNSHPAVLDGYVVKLELPELKELVSLMRRSSNNLNQLTRKVHETGRVYDAFSFWRYHCFLGSNTG